MSAAKERVKCEQKTPLKVEKALACTQFYYHYTTWLREFELDFYASNRHLSKKCKHLFEFLLKFSVALSQSSHPNSQSMTTDGLLRCIFGCAAWHPRNCRRRQ